MPKITTKTAQKKLPTDITSYDLLKTLAVILMIVDHVGYYFFPDLLWFRVLGRLCVPMWFFLVGYAGSRSLDKTLWIGGSLLVMGSILSGQAVIPPNILFTILLVRIVLDPFMGFVLKGRFRFWTVHIILLALIFPSYFILEYGVHGLILAAMGYFVRHRDSRSITDQLINQYYFFAAFSYIFFQAIAHGIMADSFQLGVLGVGTLLVMAGLNYRFKPATFPNLTGSLPKIMFWIIKLGGRKTLEIYVLHILILMVLAVIFYPERFTILDWHFIHPDFFTFFSFG